MSAVDYIPRKDTDLQAWMGPFTSLMSSNLATLGLTSGDLASINAYSSSFNSMMSDYQLKQDAAEAATQAKDDARAIMVAKARELAQKIQANVAVSNALKASMGLTVHGSHPTPPAVPFPPLDLVATIDSPGVNDLKWNRNGNGNSIIFVIQALLPSATAFIQVGTTTKSTFTHHSGLPMTRIVYQVVALHGENYSGPSNVAIVNEHTP